MSKLPDVIAEAKKIIMQLSPEDIAFPKTCNGLGKYSDGQGRWIKGAQAHVKAAMVYNKWLKETGLENEYPAIQEGEKIRFVHLKKPNYFDSDTFGFINRLPNDPIIRDFLDYETMYDKAFLHIINDILEKIGLCDINSKTTSLDELF